ncbi:MAG: signal peptidase I, partial [Bradymonadaceae bacterium]
REYAESIGLAVMFALLLRGFVIEPFKIPTKSMVPTLLVGDHLFVNKFTYGIRVPFTETYLVRFGEPEKGEVVVFTFPSDEAQKYMAKQPPARRECISQSSLYEEKDFIKRIVGTEGDTIAVRDNQLYVDGEKVDRTFVKKEPTGEFLRPHEVHERESLNGHTYSIKYTGNDRKFGPVEIKDDHVFVMGDNRNNSSDSRCWGQVPVEHIKGRAMFIWWSISDAPDKAWWNRIRGERIFEWIH